MNIVRLSFGIGVNFLKNQVMSFVKGVCKTNERRKLYTGDLLKKPEYLPLMNGAVSEFIKETFPEVKKVSEKPKLFKRLVDYTVTKVMNGCWELSEENEALGKLVTNYTKIEDASEFTAIKVGGKELKVGAGKNIAEYKRAYEADERKRPQKVIVKNNKTEESYAISINPFGDDEIRGYLSNLYRLICGGECAPKMVMIYNEKNDDFYLGSRFLDKKFETFADWRTIVGTNENGLRILRDDENAFRPRVIYADFLKEWNKGGKTNIGKILAAVMFLSDYDPHYFNVMFDSKNGLFGTIDHDGSFLNLYTKDWRVLRDLVSRTFIFNLNDGKFPVSDLLEGLEGIVQLTEEELVEELNGHIELLNSLGLGMWKSGIQLPFMPEFQYDEWRGVIVDSKPKKMNGLVELLKERQVVLEELIKVLKVETVIQGDDLGAFKQLEGNEQIKSGAASDWFGLDKKATLLECVVYYKARIICEYLLENATVGEKLVGASGLNDKGMFQQYWAKVSCQEKVEFISQLIHEVSYEIGALLLQNVELKKLETEDQLLIVGALYRKRYLAGLIQFLNQENRLNEARVISGMVAGFMQTGLLKKEGERKVLDLEALGGVIKDFDAHAIIFFLIVLRNIVPQSFDPEGINIVKLLMQLGKYGAIVDSDGNEIFCKLFSEDKVFIEYVQLYVESGIRNNGEGWGSDYMVFIRDNSELFNRLDGLSGEDRELLLDLIQKRGKQLNDEDSNLFVLFNPVEQYLKDKNEDPVAQFMETGDIDLFNKYYQRQYANFLKKG